MANYPGGAFEGGVGAVLRLVPHFWTWPQSRSGWPTSYLTGDQSLAQRWHMVRHYLTPNLGDFGRKFRSQNDEDGVIERIFECIPPLSRYCVEFGIGPNHADPGYSNGLEGNTVWLHKKGWQGLMMDGGEHPQQFHVAREYITALNINRHLRKYNTPQDCDLISIDVDGQDFWIWLAIDWQPTLFIVELQR